MSYEIRKVPTAALRCVVGPFLLGDNGEDAKSAPFRMVARSGDAIDHWWWGKVVHDLSGMRRHKDKLAIDYVHDDKEIIGYANRFDTSSGDLEVSGALVPYKENDRASEIVHKAKQGVPYEASINFGGDHIAIEEYGLDDDVEVNGREFSGPITVIREWPLRGIAVCPYGADANTSTEFSNSQSEITVMAHKTETPEVAEPETVEAELTVDAVEDNDSAVEAPEAVETAPEELAATEPPEKTGQDYLDAFGDQGGVWFAKGVPFEDAQNLFVDALQKENEALKQKLSAKELVAGEQEPIDFESDEKPKGTTFIRLASR